MSKKMSRVDWSSVENALEQGGSSGNRMAVIETNKIFNKALEERKFPGDTPEKKIQNVQSIFTNLDKLNYARAIHDKIISELNYEISVDETQELISAYYQAIIDITQLSKGKLNIFTRVKFKISNLFRFKLMRRLKNTTILLIVFFILVVLLSDTQIGTSIALKFIDFARFVVYKLLLYIGIVIGAGIVLLGLVYWWEVKRNKSDIAIEKEDES